jgi:polyhydroxybutyrate depolymerase
MFRTIPVMLARAAVLAGLACLPLICWARVPGCGAVGLSSGTYTLPHGGLTRAFRLYVPPGYKSSVPSRLVVMFHGWGENEDAFLGDSGVIDEARARGYILVAPRGLGSGPPDHSNNSWTLRGSATGLAGAAAKPESAAEATAICDAVLTPDNRYPSCKAAGIANNSCSWTQCQDDDVRFTVALVRYLETKLCVDTAHVFATGGSNGGMFTWELGQNPLSAPTFRAIASVIGLPHRGYLGGPGKSGPMPAMVITGLNDIVVPPGDWDSDAFTTTSNDNDRFYYTGATAITKSWAAAAGCDTSGKERAVALGGTHADCRTYCAATDSGWPAVIDCRAPMGHDYGLPWSWKLSMDFFDRQ